MSLLSYSSPSPGPVKVFVSLLPVFPLEITVHDSEDVTATAELIEDGEANLIRIGPGKGFSDDFDVILRAVNRPHSVREVVTSILPGAVFSQTASIGGNSRTVQCAGEMWVGNGHGRARGAYLNVSRRSGIHIATSGTITVRHNGQAMSIERAAELYLLEVER